jgi:hypothetical protein
MQNNTFMGMNGFVWWMGVVENRLDPLNLGRCQIRIFGWHTDNLQLIPSADLPWAQPITNDPDTFKTPKEGAYVMGFFFDGESGQFPVYLGVLPGVPRYTPNQGSGFSDQRTAGVISNTPAPVGQSPQVYPNRLNEPTTSRLARNENIDQTIIGTERNNVQTGIKTADGGSWDQPAPTYATVVPYNRVLDTESGHAMEFDDTKGAERIHIAHRMGTYEEIRPDGSKVIKVVGSNYELIAGDDHVSVTGKCHITVGGDATLNVIGGLTASVSKNANINVTGKVLAKASEFDLTGPVNITGSVTINGDTNMQGALSTSGSTSVGGSLSTGGSVSSGGSGNFAGGISI